MNLEQIKAITAHAKRYLKKEIEVDSYASDMKTIIRRNYYRFVEIFPPIHLKDSVSNNENMEIHGYLISADNENDRWMFKLSLIVDAFEKDSFLDSRVADK